MVIAHVRSTDNGTQEVHGLSGENGHLAATAGLAGKFATSFSAADWAYLAGWWHDLGKFKPDFQNYIRKVTGYERDEAEEGGPGKVDHTAAGAIHAVQKHPAIGRIFAYAIAGHHSGLPDWQKVLTTSGSCLEERLKDKRHLEDAIKGNIPAQVMSAQLPTSQPPFKTEKEFKHGLHLWIRMLFSCLVDADFLDTEAFMDPEKSSRRRPTIDLNELRSRYDAFMAQISVNALDTPINRIRTQILMECRKGAELEPGFFSLSVPTGGGKTLASIGFALDHAIRYGKSRIIVAIPFTSIIEQTAEVLRKVFGEEAVLEHHSNLDPDKESPASKMATENWDAPIIVTTNVQLFESLFAARTSACRKLHNIVNSVIILDEAQVLPPEYLKPILQGALMPLANNFGVSVVLCTATQPALTGHIGSPPGQHGQGGFAGIPHEAVRELMQSPSKLAEDMRRTQIVPFTPNMSPSNWEIVAEKAQQYSQVLCIVNTRKDCRKLHSLMPAGTIHLSALMCGEHRSQLIGEIKAKLKEGSPIRVVSTQLVEAGVDLDFPVVFRAMAGLDSIAQAAGRCNREGILKDEQGHLQMGQVFVFQPEKPAPLGLLRFGEQAGQEMFRLHSQKVATLSHDLYKIYFSRYYYDIHSFDKKNLQSLLFDSAQSCQFQFRTAAKEFSLIDDKAQKSILVWFSVTQNEREIDSRILIDTLKNIGPTQDLMRKLQRFCVNVSINDWKNLASQGHIRPLQGPQGDMDIWAQCVPSLYDSVFGLRLEGPEFQGDEFIC
jgi:CRISPR-associated endonuclease/helicase Cas3